MNVFDIHKWVKTYILKIPYSEFQRDSVSQEWAPLMPYFAHGPTLLHASWHITTMSLCVFVPKTHVSGLTTRFTVTILMLKLGWKSNNREDIWTGKSIIIYSRWTLFHFSESAGKNTSQNHCLNSLPAINHIIYSSVVYLLAGFCSHTENNEQ